MKIVTPRGNAEIWAPHIDSQRLSNGAYLVRQVGELERHPLLLADYLDHWANASPDGTWLAARGTFDAWRTISYGEAQSMAKSIGASLLHLGLGPKRPLLILSENSLEHAIISAACFYVGIPFFPLPPVLSKDPKKHAILKSIAEMAAPGAVFTQDASLNCDALEVLNRLDCCSISVENASFADHAFDRLPKGRQQDAEAARASLGPETVVKYLLTSDTTGPPEAAIHTNRMICTNQAMTRDCFRFLTQRPPCILDSGPWNHVMSGNWLFYMMLTNGGMYYLDTGRPIAGGFGDTLRSLREVPVTLHACVSPAWRLILGTLEDDTNFARVFLSNLDAMIYFGPGMDRNLWHRMRLAAFSLPEQRVHLVTTLGATDTSPISFTSTDAHLNYQCAGLPMKGLATKLVPYRCHFELRLKGPTVTRGYLNDPELTEAAFDDEGYFCTNALVKPIDVSDFSKGFVFSGQISDADATDEKGCA